MIRIKPISTSKLIKKMESTLRVNKIIAQLQKKSYLCEKSLL